MGVDHRGALYAGQDEPPARRISPRRSGVRGGCGDRAGPLHLEHLLLSDAYGATHAAAGLDGALLVGRPAPLSAGSAGHLLHLVRLLRILSGLSPPPEHGSLAFATADATGDGVLDIADVVMLTGRIQPAASAPQTDVSGSSATVTLHDEPVSPGRHTVVWDGRDSAGHEAPAGVYMCRMTTSTGYTQTRRMRLIR